jgi:hypothetical protein
VLIASIKYYRDALYRAKLNELWKEVVNRSFLKVIWNIVIWWTITPTEKVSESQKSSQKVFILYIIIFIFIIYFNA